MISRYFTQRYDGHTLVDTSTWKKINKVRPHKKIRLF
nr:MAG TPA: hypothetical protein [Caudoviricetes sp.]